MRIFSLFFEILTVFFTLCIRPTTKIFHKYFKFFSTCTHRSMGGSVMTEVDTGKKTNDKQEKQLCRTGRYCPVTRNLRFGFSVAKALLMTRLTCWKHCRTNSTMQYCLCWLIKTGKISYNLPPIQKDQQARFWIPITFHFLRTSSYRKFYRGSVWKKHERKPFIASI